MMLLYTLHTHIHTLFRLIQKDLKEILTALLPGEMLMQSVWESSLGTEHTSKADWSELKFGVKKIEE